MAKFNLEENVKPLIEVKRNKVDDAFEVLVDGNVVLKDQSFDSANRVKNAMTYVSKATIRNVQEIFNGFLGHR